MLLLADKKLGEQLSRQMGETPMLAVDDPYAALEEMSRRNWPVVVLSADSSAGGPSDFAGLCRASRRLQPRARLYAICTPRLEPDVHPLLGDTLDDYFISPLSAADVATLTAEGQPQAAPAPVAAVAPPPPAPAVAAIPGGLTAGEVSRLVGATFSRGDLENCIAQMVAGKAGCRVEWVDQDSAAPGQRVLLRLGGGPARLLVADGAAELSPPAEALLTALAECLQSLGSVAKRTESLHHLAITDELTGAYNRRYFYHATDQILRQVAKLNHRATLLLYDIDDFKGYNDRYSYAVGDEILRETAALMRKITRQHDIVARIGGDEFAVLFWDPDEPRSPDSKPPDSAYVLATRFLRAIERHRFVSLGPAATGTLTISGGLAGFPADGGSCRELLRRANGALKAAKQSGKNSINIVGQFKATDEKPKAKPTAKPKRATPKRKTHK